MRGPRMIIATTTDRGTDEDSESAGRVTRSITDNYMHRPSVENRAMHALSTMANNDLAMMGLNGGDRHEEPVMCDAAFVFINRKQARFLVAGASCAYHFEKGELAHRSLPGETSPIGIGPRFEPRMEPVFELNKEENAFLVASPSLARAVTDEQVTEALRASKTPEEWMEGLKRLAGDDTQFCAITCFLPLGKPPLKGLLSRMRTRRPQEH